MRRLTNKRIAHDRGSKMTDMHGKTVVVTGATNGLGRAMAQALAGMGADTRIVGRSESKSRKTAEQIKRESGNPDVRYYVADLSAQQDVAKLAATLRSDLARLDVLINNAGAWFTDRELSVDGIEMTWALNHLSYFLLTRELLDLLKATAAEHGEARIINQSSSAHANATIHWDDIEFKDDWGTEGKGVFGAGWAVYAQSKLANLLFTFALAQQLEGTGVTANAVHPGVVVTGFSQNNGLFYKAAAPIRKLFNRNTPADGAQPAIHLASAAEARGITSKYYGPPQVEKSPQAIAHDSESQNRLWRLSERMLGI